MMDIKQGDIIMLEFMLYILMEVIFYNLGRVTIFVLSFGRARAARLRESFSKAPRNYAEDGKMLVPPEATYIIGVLTLVGIICLAAALH